MADSTSAGEAWWYVQRFLAWFEGTGWTEMLLVFTYERKRMRRALSAGPSVEIITGYIRVCH